MKKKILTLALCTLVSSPVFASTWNYIPVGNDEAVFYFDADTVVKTRETTTLWVKYVQTTAPDTDGSWSSAVNWRLNCSKRTIQSLGWSSYTKEGKFIKSGEKVGQESAVIPDSTGEAVLKIACQANFPRDTSGTTYFKINDNDIFQATSRLVELRKSQQDNAPK